MVYLLSFPSLFYIVYTGSSNTVYHLLAVNLLSIRGEKLIGFKRFYIIQSVQLSAFTLKNGTIFQHKRNAIGMSLGDFKEYELSAYKHSAKHTCLQGFTLRQHTSLQHNYILQSAQAFKASETSTQKYSRAYEHFNICCEFISSAFDTYHCIY